MLQGYIINKQINREFLGIAQNSLHQCENYAGLALAEQIKIKLTPRTSPSFTIPGSLLPPPRRLHRLLALSSVARSTALKGTLLLFSRCSNLLVAVMMVELPAVSDVRRYIVSLSSDEKRTGFVESGPASIANHCLLFTVYFDH